MKNYSTQDSLSSVKTLETLKKGQNIELDAVQKALSYYQSIGDTINFLSATAILQKNYWGNDNRQMLGNIQGKFGVYPYFHSPFDFLYLSLSKWRYHLCFGALGLAFLLAVLSFFGKHHNFENPVYALILIVFAAVSFNFDLVITKRKHTLYNPSETILFKEPNFCSAVQKKFAKGELLSIKKETPLWYYVEIETEEYFLPKSFAKNIF